MIGILLGSAESKDHRGLCSRWVRAIANQGLNVVAVKSGQDEEYYEHLFDVLHGFLLPGGDTDVFCEHYDYSRHQRQPVFDRARDETAALITKACIERRIPLLGICRGMQEINLALGGRISGLSNHDHGYQYKEKREMEVHDIRIEKGGMLERIAPHIQMAQVNSIHRFGIAREEIANSLRVEALCPQDDVIEALSLPGHNFFLGVQFHAEFSSTGGLNETILGRFGEAARTYSQLQNTPLESISARIQILQA